MTLAAVYLRVSKADDESDESLTLTTQRRRIRAFCEARDWEYGPEYIDDGISATKARDSSTQWAAMLSDLRDGKFDVIVARDLDRLLRTLQDLVKLIELDAKVATVDGDIDLTTADGEFRATMLAGVARFEIRRKSERAIHANETRRRRGLPVSRSRILGYDDDGVTQIDDEAVGVRDAFERYLQGVGMAQISRELNAKGFTTGRGRPWTPANLRSLLENSRYKGVITKWETDPKRRQNGHKMSEQEYTGSFEPIVTPETWDAVQLKLTDPLRKREWGADAKYLLTGIARCGRCDDDTRLFTQYAQRTPYTGKDGARREFEPTRLYGCVAHRHLSRMAEPVEDFVEEQLLWRLGQPDAEALFDVAEDTSIDRDALQTELGELKASYQGLARLFTQGILDEEGVAEESGRIRARVLKIEGQLAPPPSKPGHTPLRAGELVEEWKNLELSRKRAVLETIMSVTIQPSPPRRRRQRGFDPTLIDIDFKIAEG